LIYNKNFALQKYPSILKHASWQLANFCYLYFDLETRCLIWLAMQNDTH